MERFGLMSLADEINQDELLTFSSLSLSDEQDNYGLPPNNIQGQMDPNFYNTNNYIRQNAYMDSNGQMTNKRPTFNTGFSSGSNGYSDMSHPFHSFSGEHSTCDLVEAESVGEIDETFEDHDETYADHDQEHLPEENKMVESDQDEKKNDTDQPSTGKNVIHTLFSPTELGVAAATREEKSSSNKEVNDDVFLKKGDKENVEHLAEENHQADNLKKSTARLRPNAFEDSTDDYNDIPDNNSSKPKPFEKDHSNIQFEIANGLRNRMNNDPIQISINNYYNFNHPPYFYNGCGYYNYSMSNPNELSEREDKQLTLPSPWSESLNKDSKASYALATYFQWCLNVVTLLSVGSVTISFLRALRKDMTSTWEHNKLELQFESTNCELQYMTNDCDTNASRLPALAEKCRNWNICRQRNNDIFFRARSTLSARLFGDVINSFIEPIGWKALLVVCVTFLIWCFGINFLLGYTRAKIYLHQDPPSKKTKETNTQSYRNVSQPLHAIENS